MMLFFDTADALYRHTPYGWASKANTVNPTETFVADAMTGQDVVTLAREFHEKVLPVLF